MQSGINNLQIPTAETIKIYAERFDHGQYGVSERPALLRLFREHPSNSDFETVLIKIAALNSLYSTFVRSIHLVPMAQHIVQLKIDRQTEGGTASETIVNEIARVKTVEKGRVYFSFASKYCHFQNPGFYPIYDSLVAKLLIRYNRQNCFFHERLSSLKDYPQFRGFIQAFRSQYGLNEISWSDLDKFLWRYGKDLENGSTALTMQRN